MIILVNLILLTSGFDDIELLQEIEKIQNIKRE